MTDYCKFSECKRQSVYYVVYGCIDQHVADLTACQKHLTMIRDLIGQRKFRCHCGKPNIKGLYRKIDNSGRVNIITRDMDGKVTATTPNTEHGKELPDVVKDAQVIGREIDNLNDVMRNTEAKWRKIAESGWYETK